MSVVWELDLPDSEKLALLALADCANDEGYCWPSMATLAKKCSKSDRTVQKAIQSLMEKGHLSRDERPGKGVFYRIHPRRDFAPETASPPKGTTPTPEAASDKPSRTINTPQTPQPVQDEAVGKDTGDQFWRTPPGTSWADAGPMLRQLEGKPEQRTRRMQPPPVAGTSPVPRKPNRPVNAKARETDRSAIMHAALRRELGSAIYQQWFEHTAMIHDEPGAKIIVGSQFQQLWLEDRFRSKMLSAARHAFGDGVHWVRVQVEHHG